MMKTQKDRVGYAVREVKGKAQPHPRLYNRKEEPVEIGVTVLFSERQLAEIEKVAEERKWPRSQTIRELALMSLERLKQGGSDA